MAIRYVVETRKKQLEPETVDSPGSWDVGPFTDDEIAAAVAKANAFPGYPRDDNEIATFWPRPRVMPTIEQVDFEGVTPGKAKLDELLASNRTIKRDRLLWHVQNPGSRLHVNPFTSMPLIAETDDGMVIVDGHHALGAMWLLGAKKVPVWQLKLVSGSPSSS